MRSVETLATQTPGNEMLFTISEQPQEVKLEGSCLIELDRDLRPVFLAPSRLEELGSQYPGFKSFWNRQIVFITHGPNQIVVDAIRLSSLQVRMLCRYLGLEELSLRAPDIPQSMPVEPNELAVFNGEIILVSDLQCAEQRMLNPFPLRPWLFEQRSMWVVELYDKHKDLDLIGKMVRSARRAFVRELSPVVLIDPFLHQARWIGSGAYRTRKISLPAIDADEAKTFLRNKSDERVPAKLIEWWRRFQDYVPKHGHMIMIFTKLTAKVLVRMVCWDRPELLRKVNGSYRIGNALAMKFSLIEGGPEIDIMTSLPTGADI